MLIDSPLEARLHNIEERLTRLEDRLTAIERDLAVLRGRLDEISQRIPSPWLLVGLILPLYGLLIFGFAGVFYFLLSHLP